MNRIVIDARMIRMSGIGRYIRGVLPELLKRQNWHITLMGNPADLEPYRPDAVIPLKSAIYNPIEQIEMALKTPETDLFWSPHFNAPFLPIRARKRLVTIHDIFHLTPHYQAGVFKRIYAKMLVSFSVRNADRIITVSEFSKSEIHKYLRLNPSRMNRITVIPNSLDPFYTAGRQAGPEKRNERDPFILFIGNVKPHKNITGLIRAFALVKKTYPDLRLVIIGKKENFLDGLKDLEKQMKDLNLNQSVVFTGELTDEEVMSAYKNALCLVLPSFYEGFGYPPLEAMACGCPVIVSDIPAFREVCGEAVWYVDPRSDQSIAGGITRVLSDAPIRDELVQKGSLKILNFRPEVNIQRHLAVFEDLLRE